MDSAFIPKDFGRNNRYNIENAVMDFCPAIKIIILNYWFLGRENLEKNEAKPETENI